MRLILCTTLFVAIVANTFWVRAEDDIQFNRDIRPLLSSCLRCHGPDEATRESGLRLDIRANALAPADSGESAIVPGKPGSSELLNRISTDDDSLRMPPEEAGKPLSPEAIAKLRKWIEDGASYETHWAWKPPASSPLPAVKNSEWSTNPIDQFVLAQLEQRGLSPNRQADRYTLIRRVTLALTGLPPTQAEVAAFIADDRPAAYERLVDRLLAAPSFGERWARPWLDLARYADSAGYAQDPERKIWRYRDWVIEALNANKPYDEFTIEQLAGDMLAEPREDQLIATAFHRNTMTNSEGGTNDEEFRNAAVVDRVNTTMQVWTGLTMGCAQCHDHKYDPISQRDYFAMFAVFNNSADADRGDESPVLNTFTHSQIEQRRQWEREIADLKKQIEADAKKNQNASPSESPLPTGPLAARFIRVELPGADKFLSLAELQAFAGEKNVAQAGVAKQKSTDYEGAAARAIDGNTNGDYQAGKSVSHTARDESPWWEVDLQSVQQLQKISIWNRTDGVGDRLAGFTVVLLDDKRQPIWATSISAPPAPSVTISLPKQASEASAADKKTLASYQTGNPDQSPAEKRLAALEKQLKSMKGQPTPIMRELPENRRRKTFIQIRGNFQVLGAPVSAAVPEFMPPLPEGSTANRLSVARWLIDDANPLTARVAVNRAWEQIFGRGLVNTSEDFGVQGDLPTHPELLDWLAVDFRTHGWDVKRLMRMIVTSSTCRQDSSAPASLTTVDPDNAWLARGPRFRMSGEMIRDMALDSAGLLSRKLYGESVRPPRPVMGLKAAFGGSTDWKTSAGEDRFRRGLYTKWRRTTPYPSLMTFDAPSREFCTIRRIRTNTPLQALVTLNDPVFVEAAQGFARMIEKHGGETATEKSRWAFERVVARPPNDRELSRVVELWETVRTEYASDPAAAKQLAEDPIGPAPPKTDLADLAAWTIVANVLLNLDEVIAPR
ncbi:MAG: DUF1553 domain-containing protein [bacterium]|nr:DUF1553 domain-containing protein [bacterium]